MKYYQQGDVLLKSCDKPSKAEILKTDLLHKGQNHHHKLRGKFAIAKDNEGKLFVHSKGSELYHEEHKTIEIPKGFYELGIVNEYDHWTEESRQVID